MDMPTDPGSALGSLENLPITDQRCNNDACIAFRQGHLESQQQISYASQFLYGHWLAIYYCGIIIIAILIHGYSRFNNHAPRLSKTSGSSLWQKTKAALRYWSYRRLHGRVADYLDLPSFGTMSVLLLGVTMTLVMTFFQRPYYRTKRGFGGPPLAIRTGLMSAALIPLIVALAGKVNLISLSTGLGHEKINVFHRYAGWLMFVLSTIHMIPFFVSLHREGGYAYVRRQFYAEGSMEFTGTPGYAFAFALAALSVPYVRRKMYEVFVWSHIIFAILFFALMFWHFGNIGDSWVYLWATLAIWVLQLASRMFWKASIFNLRGNWFEGSRATVSKATDGTLRISIAVPTHYRWRPGQHMYLRFPYLNAFDNHPFSIASVCGDARNLSEIEYRDKHKMLFLVKPCGGATGKLADFAEKNPKMKISAAIDGPYGTRLPRFENTYDKVILIAGGTGVSAVLPILTDMCLKLSDPACVTKKVQFVWIMRHMSALEWIRSELSSAISSAPNGTLDAWIYVTADARDHERAESIEEKDSVSSASDEFEDLPGTAIHHGHRPNLLMLVPFFLGKGRMAVVGCGPTSLRNDLSNACATAQKRVLNGSAKEIFLHTESFDW